MYLNIILTLLFLAIAWNGLIFSLLLAMMRKEGTSGRLEIDEQRAYTKGINTKMVGLHDGILYESVMTNQLLRNVMDELKRWRT